MNIITYSIKQVVSVFIILILLLIFFAILGVNLFKGTLNYRCRTTQAPINGEWPIAPNSTRVCGGNYKCPSEYFCEKYISKN